MGEAKRKRVAGDRVSWCRDCTLCCTIPEILSLEKPMYRPCGHLAGDGCGIFGQPQRPAVCLSFRCAYLAAREDNSADRHVIPHPQDAGAYLAVDPAARLLALFVDPRRPEEWKASGLPDYLRRGLAHGFSVEIIDRGRRMVVKSPPLFEQVLKLDYVAYADREGRPRDFPSYESERA